MDLKNDRAPSFAIGRANHVLQSEIRAQLAAIESPLSSEGASILLLLDSIGAPIRVNELARIAVRDGTTLKRQIDSLVKLDYVVQTKDPSDGRVVLISNTESGNEAIEKHVPMFDTISQKALNGILEEDIQKTISVLNTIRANLLVK